MRFSFVRHPDIKINRHVQRSVVGGDLEDDWKTKKAAGANPPSRYSDSV